MSKHPIGTAMVAAVLLVGLPTLGSAAEPTMIHSCVSALMSQLAAQSKAPVKLLRTVGDYSSETPLLNLSQDIMLTARDAHTDRLIAQMVCTLDRQGQVSLQPVPRSLQ